ncbi:hypothetical protein Gpo141_00002462 [Globisporangium polare]
MEAPRLLSLTVSSEQFQEHDAVGTASNGPGRRSLRRKNCIARGLARRYDDQKGREDALKARISRQKKQLAILAEYNRRQEAESTKSHQQNGITKQLNSSTELANRSIVLQKSSTGFPRNVCLRVLADNQKDDDEGVEGQLGGGEELNSPTEEDLARFAALTAKPEPRDNACAPSPVKAAIPTINKSNSADQGSTSKRGKSLSSGGSSIDKSSAQVLCELRVTKEIVIREQTLKQLRQLVPVVDKLAEELSEITQKRASASALLVSAASSPLREKRGSSSLAVAPLSTRRPESGQISLAAAERNVKELSMQFNELADTLKHRVGQFRILFATLQEASMNAAEAIIEWRHFRTHRCRFTNFQPLYRFPWKKLRVLNYLRHMDEDLQFLFQTAVLRVVAGPDVTYNALLLPRDQLESQDFATFLTEKRSRDEDGASPAKAESTPLPPHKLEQQYEALRAALKSEGERLLQPLAIDSDRARHCLEIIQAEKELEKAEAERIESEQQRAAEAYNPFASIKASGGVEETLTQLLTTQSPHVAALSKQLRHRQEDTTRAANKSAGASSVDQEHDISPKVPREPSEQLHVNSRRLRQILEKRKEQTVLTAECEVQSVPTWGTKKNRLPGQLVVRKMTVKRQQNQLARKIQLQFRTHLFRRNLLQNLASFIAETRQSAVHIQRIFRGFCVKREYDITKMLLEAERRRLEAGRKILHSYRRYKRRLRHRRSMTVESIAQAQLFTIQYQKLQEEGEDSVDRYRRVGEERRRQRVVLLQKRKLEQQELEQRRHASAIKIQALVRGHLAKCELFSLRKEKKSHLTAVCIMALQSNVRSFLKRQDERRRRFRQDLERVNRSAVRIQSIYRGYNSRVSLLVQLDETMKESLERRHADRKHDDLEEEDEDNEDEEDTSGRLPPLGGQLSHPPSRSDNDDSFVMISSPPMASRAPGDQTTRVALPPLRPSVVAVSSSTPMAKRPSFARQLSTPHAPPQSMSRVELRLKEPVIGDDFEKSVSVRRDSLEPRRMSRGSLEAQSLRK